MTFSINRYTPINLDNHLIKLTCDTLLNPLHLFGSGMSINQDQVLSKVVERVLNKMILSYEKHDFSKFISSQI